MTERNQPDLSRHARRRCQQRGIRPTQVQAVLDNHDLDHAVGDNCVVLRLSHSRAGAARHALGPQSASRLARIVVILNEQTGRIVTVMHDHRTARAIVDGCEGKGMAQVIAFPGVQPREDTLVAKARRARMLRAALDAHEVFSAEDQLRAAENLHRLLEVLARSHRIAKRAVAEAAGLGGQGKIDSTRRLDPYTLPEGATPERRKRMAKKPRKYFKFAEAIATLSEGSPDTSLCQIFEGCSFGSGIAVEQDWDEHRWGRLADRLRKLGAAVVQRARMDRYWERTAQINGDHTFRKGCIRPGVGPVNRVDITKGLAGFAAYPDDMPPLPSVLLGQRCIASQGEGMITFRSGNQLLAAVSLWLEVRLALGPVNAASAVGAMLEFRTRLEASVAGTGRLVLDNPYCDGSGGSDTIGAILMDGAWEDVAAFPCIDAGPADYRGGCEHAYFGWQEINPALLRSLFGHVDDPFDMTYESKVTHFGDLPPSRFTPDTAAFFLDAQISDGLDRDLIADCRRCSAILDFYQQEHEDRVVAAEAAAEKRWSRNRTQDQGMTP